MSLKSKIFVFCFLPISIRVLLKLHFGEKPHGDWATGSREMAFWLIAKYSQTKQITLLFFIVFVKFSPGFRLIRKGNGYSKILCKS